MLLKEGDASVRKCNMVPWNWLLNKQNIPFRKPSIILKRYSSISSCTWGCHSIPWGQCMQHAFLQVSLKKMQYVFIPLKRWWLNFSLRRPNCATGRKPRTKLTKKKLGKNKENKIFRDSCLDPPLSRESGNIICIYLFCLFCFLAFWVLTPSKEYGDMSTEVEFFMVLQGVQCKHTLAVDEHDTYESNALGLCQTVVSEWIWECSRTS